MMKHEKHWRRKTNIRIAIALVILAGGASYLFKIKNEEDQERAQFEQFVKSNALANSSQMHSTNTFSDSTTTSQK